MKSIFPTTIDGDLFKLVHFNAFKVITGAKALKAGDVCQAEAKVTARYLREQASH